MTSITLQKLIDKLGERLQLPTDPLPLRITESMIKRLDGREFFEPSEFSWITGMDSQWKAIRKEVEGLLEEWEKLPNFQDVSPEQYRITTDNRWKTYIFYVYGNKVEENCERCPMTTRALASIPGMKTAMFSILAPRKHITRHRGPYAGVLRYHLGLIVPKDKTQCRIQVGKTTRHWEEGVGMVFDDSHEHEVWNDTDEIRVVLFVDFIRPLPFPLSLGNELIVSYMNRTPLVRNAVRNAKAWGRR